jgi:hypothetical protein
VFIKQLKSLLCRSCFCPLAKKISVAFTGGLAQQRFELLNKHSTLEDLKTAFAVEGLSQEFYQKLFAWYSSAQPVFFPTISRSKK